MSIMDILDPFTMKNVIIYEKGWKVCLKWDISCSIWMQGRIVWARNRQKWQLGEYEGERGSCIEIPLHSTFSQRERMRERETFKPKSLFFLTISLSLWESNGMEWNWRRRAFQLFVELDHLRKGGWKEREREIHFLFLDFLLLQRPNLQTTERQTNNPSLHHDHPLNLSILLSGGKENNHDGESNSEWKHQEWVQHENLCEESCK